jgi:hypothetical protein
MKEDNPEVEKKEKKVKQKMTEKQKSARLANLEAGRKKRMELMRKKKEVQQQEEYDLSSKSSSEESPSDDDAFIISKKKKKSKKVVKQTESPLPKDDPFRNELNEIKNIVVELANLQKKQNKAQKHTNKSSGGTKIVVLPQNTTQAKQPNDSVMEMLRKSIM